ncbi:peptide/nickel transport system substrate-binding protein [Jatrophihabitans endophyticus]|uniref:Peptide/nickel transport system substrate-binding protein n=1 Tax=Jatrophihabitans endophyticus TaxID=1206085 RepID=A0A1M5S296_9ACTN|nr:ABC transporter substrate-binding protein [Jatrophihabitans endophyticus]SHH32133.1 peptide/nickel transport system substrate-binding protein [Jatrophihabitans endophyticus]
MTLRRRAAATTLAALTAAGLLTACQTEPLGGAGSVFTVDLSSYPASLDPGLQYNTDSYAVYRNIFDQLLRRDRTSGKVVGSVATSWRRTSQTRWVFTLRDGIRFSDGSRLTAADAAYSINRILDPKLASGQLANFSAIRRATGLGTRLVIDTKYPSPTLLTFLTTLSIVPQAYVRRVGNDAFNARPMGSGPYRFVSAINGSQIALDRNTRYWGPRPQLAKVTFRAVPDIASRVADLQSGLAQVATSMTPDSAVQIRDSSNLKILSAPTERVSYLAFNTIKGGPTNDPQVRRAISLAIDYRGLIDKLQQGYARQVNSVLTPLAVGYDKALADYRYDPDAARALIAKAGAKGKTVVMATSPTYDPNIVQAIQADIQAAGLQVSIRNSDQATYLKKVQSPSHDWGSIRFGQWSCSCLDADGTIFPLFRSGTVWSSYRSDQFDTLVDRGRAELGTAQRRADYARALQLMNRDVPGIGLFQVGSIYGVTKSLQWRPDAQESFFLADMRLAS